MSKFEATYPTPRYGLATSFNESEVPTEYALRLRNRFINAAGGLEKRQGISQFGNTVSGTPEIKGIHELTQSDGTVILFVSGNGTIYKYDDTDTFASVHTGLDTSARIRSIQFGGKLIFYNGIDRNIFTEDGTTFSELKAIVERGELAGAVSAGGSDDSDIPDWALTNVSEDDILYNIDKDASAIITGVTTANVTHTAIGSGASGLGQATGDNIAGDRYEIIDHIPLNIIPTSGEKDNTAVAGPGTDTITVAVSGVNFSTTLIKVGDIVRNTTRSAIARVDAIATALTVTSVVSQAADDALVFHKSAMPIAELAHTHYGRAYYVDAREKNQIRISGPNSPEDMTTSFGTLDATSFSFADQQPQGDIVLTMASFQRFFAVGGRNYLLMFSGTDPIADTTADSSDFVPIGLFPQGTVSKDSIISLGNDAAFVSPDGIQTVAMVEDASSLERANISEAIKTTLRDLIKNTNEDDIQLYHYPRRSWLMFKIGTQLYVFNYTSFLGIDRTKGGYVSKLDPREGSWSLFDGNFARQNIYFIRRDGTMLCAGAGGKVYEADKAGVYSDDGESYSTEYQTGWLDISGSKSKNTKIKQGNYIKPVLDAGASISYTIQAEGNFAVDSGETITVDASGGSKGVAFDTIPFIIGGSNIQNDKHQLRWRGEQVRLTYKTTDALGPDTISRHTIYGSQWGVR